MKPNEDTSTTVEWRVPRKGDRYWVQAVTKLSGGTSEVGAWVTARSDHDDLIDGCRWVIVDE